MSKYYIWNTYRIKKIKRKGEFFLYYYHDTGVGVSNYYIWNTYGIKKNKKKGEIFLYYYYDTGVGVNPTFPKLAQNNVNFFVLPSTTRYQCVLL